jgi:hypothetical protein
MENIYESMKEAIQKRKENFIKSKAELEEIEEKISGIETGSRSYLNGTYSNLASRRDYLKLKTESYKWTRLGEEEFNEWYMKENDYFWKIKEERKEEIVCDSCSKNIKRPEDIRSFGNVDYHPNCFEKYATETLENEIPVEDREFILRTLRIGMISS